MKITQWILLVLASLATLQVAARTIWAPWWEATMARRLQEIVSETLKFRDAARLLRISALVGWVPVAVLAWIVVFLIW